MTPEQLSEIEARLRAATPGPFIHSGHGCIRGGPVRHFERGSSQTQVAMTTGQDWMTPEEQLANAEMLAHAPQDIAALIAEVKRLREALRQACTCATCNGAGEIDFVTGYKDNGPNDPIRGVRAGRVPGMRRQQDRVSRRRINRARTGGLPMTPAEIAAMVVDADDWFRVNGNHPVRGDELAKHVRALAAECERLQAFEAATADASSRSARAKATMYANMRIEIESLHAKLEAVTRELQLVRESLRNCKCRQNNQPSADKYADTKP